MRRKILLFILSMGLLTMQTVFAQYELFETFPDSTTLNKAGDSFIQSFVNEVNAIDTSLHLVVPKTVYNLMGPYFYSKDNTMNLPVWSLSPQWYKDFCVETAGSTKKGKAMFGLFFNGFYIPHELGHAIQYYLHQYSWSEYLANAYNNEYEANIIGMLYWKKHDKSNELKKCYGYARQALTKLKSPVPAGTDPKKYFSQHYDELGKDVNGYGFFQFTQYVQVYEALDTLPDFNAFIKKMASSKPTPEDLVQQQVNGFNAGNIDAFLKPYADSAELYYFPGNRYFPDGKLMCKGKDTMRQIYGAELRKFSNIHCEVIEHIIQGNFIINKESITGWLPSPDTETVVYYIKTTK